jgi:Tfp pilus assembly protein PilE
MRRNEQGVTLIGFLIMAVFLGLFALAAIKLLPVYLEYGKVTSTLEKAKAEFDGKSPTTEEIYRSIERRFDIEDVRRINFRDIKIKREPRSYSVQAAYEARVYYIGNIYLLAVFDFTVNIDR